MRRLAIVAALAVLGGVLAVAGCEDDSLYKAGASTFQNDTVDGAAGAAGAGAAGARGDAGSDAAP